MKKVAVIVAVLLAVLAIGAYVLLTPRPMSLSEDPGEINPAADAAPVQKRKLSGDRAAAEVPLAADEVKDRAVQEALARIAPEKVSRKVAGIRTEFSLSGGEIGFVDVESIVRDRDPHSVIALLQKHQVLTGAGESLELEIDRVYSTRRGGHRARYYQTIGGVPTPGRGSVGFEASGAVYNLGAILVDPSTARLSSVKILQPEAVALARPVAANFVEPQRPRFEEAGKPLRVVDARTPPELRYFLEPDAANELFAAWRIGVKTYNPPDDLEVLIDAETGAVLGVKSIMEIRPAQTACTGVAFRVCDGFNAQEESCSRTA